MTEYLEHTKQFNAALQDRDDLLAHIGEIFVSHYGSRSIESDRIGDNRFAYTVGEITLEGVVYPIGLKISTPSELPIVDEMELGTFDLLYDFFRAIRSFSDESMLALDDYASGRREEISRGQLDEIESAKGKLTNSQVIQIVKVLCKGGELKDWNVPHFHSVTNHLALDKQGVLFHHIGRHDMVSIYAAIDHNRKYWAVDLKAGFPIGPPFDEIDRRGSEYRKNGLMVHIQ